MSTNDRVGADEPEEGHAKEARPRDGRLLAWPAVRERVGISRTTAWRLQKAGEFPLPVVISPGRVGWREDDIRLWLGSLAVRGDRAARTARASPLATTEAVSPPRPATKPAKPGDRQLGFDF